MKLRQHNYSEKERLSEFDMWITPSLGDIKDRIEFKNVVSNLNDGFHSLSCYTDGFADVKSCSSYNVAKKIIEKIATIDNPQKHLTNMLNAILLATGKTDNNLKCQFPIVLYRQFKSNKIAALKKGELTHVTIPRDFNLEKVINHFSVLAAYPDVLAPLLKSYLDLLLNDRDYALQLYSLGKSYQLLQKEGLANNLLSSIAIFQSRGSLTAKTGHLPEKILRSYMSDWGMAAGSDYNQDDVDIYDLLGTEKRKNEKSRKYDFIIPYLSKQTGKKLFVQCQFYGGDSGSVSHKVVDQTDAARQQTLKKYPHAVFIEYLDGAGYFSSLNGDLRKMLTKKNTKDFIQIRTAPIKFRRELQNINFITPLEIEHVLLKGHTTEKELTNSLLEQGYSIDEIGRSIHVSKECGIIDYNNDHFMIRKDREDVAIKYSLLDCIANYGHTINSNMEKGILCIPGYATDWGMNQSDLLKAINQEFPQLKISAEDFVAKVQWLFDNEFVILK